MKKLFIILLFALGACSEDPELTVQLPNLLGEWDHVVDCNNAESVSFFGSHFEIFTFYNGNVKIFDRSNCLNAFKTQYFISVVGNQIQLYSIKNLDDDHPDSLVTVLTVHKLTDTELEFTREGEDYLYKFKRDEN